MPSDRIDESLVIVALAHRHTAADAAPREAVRQLSTGTLRRFHTGAADPVMDPLRALLGVDEQAQCTQRVVDWFLHGRRDLPLFRPQMRAAIRDLYQQQTGKTATGTELDVLVNTLAGAEDDLVMVPSPLKRLTIARALVDAFVDGAD